MKTNDYQITEHNRGLFGYIYIFAYLLVIAMCTQNEALTNYGVVIPFVKINQAYPLLAIVLIGMGIVLLKKYIKVDIVMLLLICRIILCLIPALFYDMPSSYLGNFAVSCLPFFIYIFFLNYDIDIERATSILLWFGLLIAFQCIWAYIMIRQNNLATYSDLFYKNYFVIPVGATNNISAILLPLVIMGDQTINSGKYRVVYVLSLLCALFLCKSRTGLILAGLYLVSKIFIKERRKQSAFKKILICFLPGLILIAMLVLMKTGWWDNLLSLLLGYSESGGGGLDVLLSGRLSVFESVLSHIDNHPIFGNGVTYEKLDLIRSHNVFLQILYENGIVGFLGLLIFLLIAFYRIIKSKTINKFYFAFYISALFIFINAMVEETMLGHFMILYGLLFLASMKKEFEGKNKYV